MSIIILFILPGYSFRCAVTTQDRSAKVWVTAKRAENFILHTTRTSWIQVTDYRSFLCFNPLLNVFLFLHISFDPAVVFQQVRLPLVVIEELAGGSGLCKRDKKDTNTATNMYRNQSVNKSINNQLLQKYPSVLTGLIRISAHFCNFTCQRKSEIVFVIKVQ